MGRAQEQCVQDCINYNHNMNAQECRVACGLAGMPSVNVLIWRGVYHGGDTKVEGEIENVGRLTVRGKVRLRQDEKVVKSDLQSISLVAGERKKFKISTHWNPYSSTRMKGRVNVCFDDLRTGKTINYVATQLDKPAESLPIIGSTPLSVSVPAAGEKIASISMPSVGLAGKGVIGLIVFVAVAIAALLALGYSGLGGSVGRVAESEHKRKRG